MSLKTVITAGFVTGGILFAHISPVQAQEASPTKPQAGHARNIILMISDGASPNTWKAASYYRFGASGREVYDRFDVKLYASTYPLNMSVTPTLTDAGKITFDPAQIWHNTPVEGPFTGAPGGYVGGHKRYFDGYDYARTYVTDSAAAATALASGHKTYNSAINWSNNDKPLKHIGEYTVQSGRALGVVTSVPWNNATPAGFLAHNLERNNYLEISQEIVTSGLATVIMGAGHPYFDVNGRPVSEPSDDLFRNVGGREIWADLKAGNTDYKLIDTKMDFEALAAGTLPMGDKTRLIGTAPNIASLQFTRSGVAGGDKLTNQPDLATMTRGALHVLSGDEDGFFLMVEGGAVDWAAHSNNLPRIIEEQIDFNLAVEAAVKWVETHSSWDETLLIVTTDHGNGLLLGPDSDKVAYAPIINQGAGALPLVRWHTDNHTRELVPLFAKGVGSDYFLKVAKRHDGLSRHDVPESSWYYVDNTDVFHAAMAAFGLKTDQ
ncbi:MAG: alkaline phosphatase [Asticcacaulis sp.]